MLHGAISQLPFRGVGNSGKGRPHSIVGIREFSYPRGALLRSSDTDAVDAFNPSYRTVESMVNRAFEEIDGAGG